MKKKKTPNAERSTPNIEFGSCRVGEDSDGVYVPTSKRVYGPSAKTDPISNAQRSTPNVQFASKPRFDLEERLLGFSVRIIRLVDALPNTRAANHIAGQLLRCGTSAYGNHSEVEAAESRKDFLHKLKICLKELKETRRWLRLLAKSSMLPETKLNAILNETEELIRVFFSSIRTAERNSK